MQPDHQGKQLLKMTLLTLIYQIIKFSLRLLTECFILEGSTMFSAIFNLVTRRKFWNTEDYRLKINSLPLNNCFSYRNVLQNGVNTLSKMFFFSSKSSRFCTLHTKRYDSNFASMCNKYVSNKVWRNLRFTVSAFA